LSLDLSVFIYVHLWTKYALTDAKSKIQNLKSKIEMSLPITSSIELPILQELVVVGGSDYLRFLYQRLIAYFPQLSEREIFEIKNESNPKWRSAVQKAGKILDENGCISRRQGLWTITNKGIEAVKAETLEFTPTKLEEKQISHSDIQKMLTEIGFALGYYAETEFEYYDVVWRENEKTQRLSHVFEVQSKGNIDSAFAKLKRAYEAQRSKPYLIISSERDLNRAGKSLSREFQDIASEVRILTFVQIETVHRNLQNIAEIIREFLLK